MIHVQPPAAPGIDPVFAAIERHRLAHDAFAAAATREADGADLLVSRGGGSPGALAILEAGRDAACLEADHAWCDLFAVRPATGTGLAALVRHCDRHIQGYRGMDDEPDVFGALAVMADRLGEGEVQHRAFAAAAQEMLGHQLVTEIWARATQRALNGGAA